MDFYQSIASYYDDIFPKNPLQSSFVLQSIEDAGNSRLLDIGCATGSLSLSLSSHLQYIEGIDIDREFLGIAAKKSPKKCTNVRFTYCDMLKIGQQFGANSFDALVCFGNTLVHLPDMNAMDRFLKNASEVLRKDGKMLLQIIHYDRILDQDIWQLPTIDTEKICFERNYATNKSTKRIAFKSSLLIKKSGERIQNSIELYPLRKKELHKLLEDNHFGDIQFYGNFNKKELETNDQPLIIECRRL